MSQHKHEWAVMFDTSTMKVFALCIADAKIGTHFITAEQLLSGNIPPDTTCRAELNRQEIEERLNKLESGSNAER